MGSTAGTSARDRCFAHSFVRYDIVTLDVWLGSISTATAVKELVLEIVDRAIDSDLRTPLGLVPVSWGVVSDTALPSTFLSGSIPGTVSSGGLGRGLVRAFLVSEPASIRIFILDLRVSSSVACRSHLASPWETAAVKS